MTLNLNALAGFGTADGGQPTSRFLTFSGCDLSAGRMPNSRGDLVMSYRNGTTRQLECSRPNGTVRWAKSYASSAYTVTHAASISGNKGHLIACSDQTGAYPYSSYVALIDPVTGAIKWQRKLSNASVTVAIILDHVTVGDMVAISDTSVYFIGYRDSAQVLFCLEASTGALRWAKTIAQNPKSITVDASDNVHLSGDGYGSDGFIEKISSTGTRTWAKTMTGMSLLKHGMRSDGKMAICAKHTGDSRTSAVGVIATDGASFDWQKSAETGAFTTNFGVGLLSDNSLVYSVTAGSSYTATLAADGSAIIGAVASVLRAHTDGVRFYHPYSASAKCHAIPPTKYGTFDGIAYTEITTLVLANKTNTISGTSPYTLADAAITDASASFFSETNVASKMSGVAFI